MFGRDDDYTKKGKGWFLLVLIFLFLLLATSPCLVERLAAFFGF